jgi:hypothetical protein
MSEKVTLKRSLDESVQDLLVSVPAVKKANQGADADGPVLERATDNSRGGVSRSSWLIIRHIFV